MASCDVCNSTFTTKQAATQHKRTTKHCVCRICDRVLASTKGLATHTEALHSHQCPRCDGRFPDKARLRSHQRAARHCYCGDCNRVFDSDAGLAAHMRSELHATEFRCCDCDRAFRSAGALEQHLRDATHARRPAVTKATRRCEQCDRAFASPSALAQHRASSVHRPAKTLTCFAAAVSTCQKRFGTASAAVMHLESGGCVSGIDGDMLRALIAEHDTDRLVTQPLPVTSGDVWARALPLPVEDGFVLPPAAAASDDDDDDDDDESVEIIRHMPSSLSLCSASEDEGAVLVHTPSSPSLQSRSETDSIAPTTGRSSLHFASNNVCMTPTTGSVADWHALLVTNAPTLRCPFCPPTRRPFCDARALQQHFASAAHNEPFLSCAVVLSGDGGSSPRRRFTTVAGLVQHLESGACAGGAATFRKAVAYVEMRLRAMGIQLRLLENVA